MLNNNFVKIIFIIEVDPCIDYGGVKNPLPEFADTCCNQECDQYCGGMETNCQDGSGCCGFEVDITHVCGETYGARPLRRYEAPCVLPKE